MNANELKIAHTNFKLSFTTVKNYINISFKIIKVFVINCM